MGCHPCKHKVLVNNENFLCYLCLQNYPEYMHFPCGHYGICEGCRLTLRNKDSIYRKKCPVCNQKGSIKKIFFQGDEESMRRTVTDYCIHLERKKNDKLEGENKILREISDITNQKSEILLKENKKLQKENEYYKKLSENNGQKLKDMIIGYKNHREKLNLKKNLLNIKKMKMLVAQKESKEKNDKKNMYIISLIHKYQGENIELNDIDDYIEKKLSNENKISNNSNDEFLHKKHINELYKEKLEIQKYNSNNDEGFNNLEELNSLI